MILFQLLVNLLEEFYQISWYRKQSNRKKVIPLRCNLTFESLSGTMSLRTHLSLSLVACSLFLTVQGGYEGSSKGRYDDRPIMGYDNRLRVGYEGRPRAMLGETPLAGIIRPVPVGSLVPTFHSQCCPCPSANRIYPDRYVINGNQAPPPLIDLPSFNGMEYTASWKYSIHLSII